MKPYLIVLGCISAIGFATLLSVLAHAGGLPLLAPSGAIGGAERDLLYRTVFLMLIVVVPVVILAIFIGWHYREGNTRAAYTPNWEHSKMEEFIWWSIPFEIVLVLSAVTWTGTHTLDPAHTIASTEPPYVIQVVALPWKWLFLYPEEGVASVNEIALPLNRPVEFQITADAPMNSFWIPALGGQMYAMTGMMTHLHLIANVPGTYLGRSANYSGAGFAQMQFAARVLDESAFAAWVEQARASGDTLSTTTYRTIAAPSDAGPVRYYGHVTMPFNAIVTAHMPMLSIPGGMPAMHLP